MTTIAIIDDDNDALALVEELCFDEKFDVITCSSYIDLVKVIMVTKIDMVVADMFVDHF